MKKHLRFFAFFLLLAIVCPAFAACGSDNRSTVSNNATTTTLGATTTLGQSDATSSEPSSDSSEPDTSSSEPDTSSSTDTTSSEPSASETSSTEPGNTDEPALSELIINALPLVTYAMPASGESRVYSYSDSSLATLTNTYYIDTFTDEIVVTEISTDGKAVLLTYPTTSTTTPYRSRWFKVEDIFGVTALSASSYTASAAADTYRTLENNAVWPYGSIATSDVCIKLVSRKIGTGTYYPTIYPITKSTVNDVANVAYKMALVPAAGTTPVVSTYSYVSQAEISAAISTYSIGTTSNAYKALLSINNLYSAKLTSAQKQGVVVFLFEGVGSNASATERKNAMCVVVKNSKIVYLNKNCTTLPDYPFDPAKNDGTAMPTLMSGLYSFTTTNHGSSAYAALNVSGAKVVRHSNKTTYYESTSGAINVHRRSYDGGGLTPYSYSWVNSQGCQLIGAGGTGTNAEYAKFIKAVGIVGSSATGTEGYTTQVTGKIIIDRTYATSYLTNVGYSSGAITLLNKNQIK